MNNKLFIRISGLLLFLSLIIFACKEEEYTLGDLTKPSSLTITAKVVGQDTANPYGDGSGVVNITASANDALAYKIGYQEVNDLTSIPTFETMTLSASGATATKKFNKLGNINYRITIIAYGKGGTSTVITKDITVKSVFNPDPTIVTNLTGNSSKTWKVDQSVPGHFGVGPWSATSSSPEWWAAAVNEKVACCNCFYTARFTFKQVTTTSFSIQVATPDGVLTKTGSLTSLPGIPSSGDEGCYAYAGATTPFSFISSTSGITSTSDNPTTSTSILLEGSGSFIGYGALQKEYEILVINSDYMYLRVQGTEPGNAWYLKLIPA